MKNPVNRLATAAPRALDSLLETKTKKQEDDNKQKQQQKKERTCSFDLDLSGLNLLDNSSIYGSSTLGSGSTIGSITLVDIRARTNTNGKLITNSCIK